MELQIVQRKIQNVANLIRYLYLHTQKITIIKISRLLTKDNDIILNIYV